jgi:hypothetical protein
MTILMLLSLMQLLRETAVLLLERLSVQGGRVEFGTSFNSLEQPTEAGVSRIASQISIGSRGTSSTLLGTGTKS